jgi:hypothetical protein
MAGWVILYLTPLVAALAGRVVLTTPPVAAMIIGMAAFNIPR